MAEMTAEMKRVVLLDRDAAGRREAAAALSGLFPGAALAEAASLQEAQAGWSGPAPDMVMVGLARDDASGLETLRRIRAMAPDALLCLYAEATPESVRAALCELRCAMISTPVSADKIVAALDCAAAEQALGDRAATALAFA
ncbi:MAG: hypothetical protein AAGM38_18485 [Pseudomonadota bacterium]